MAATRNAMDPLQDIEPRWRTLVVAAVAVAYPVAETGFEVGAYGELFFNNKFSAWITVTATMIVLALIPRKNTEHLRVQIWILAIPSVWMLVRLYIGYTNPGAIVHPILFVAGHISFAFCVPYAIYLIVRIANPGLPDLRETRLRVVLAVIAITFFAAGYGIGVRNDLFQSCQDLRIQSDELPAHCQKNGSTDGSIDGTSGT